jgi:hypothetical protein
VRIYDGIRNAEYAQAILGGLVTIVNRNLGITPPPRVYFPIQPGQSARVRAITPGGDVATVFLQAYADLAQAASGDVIAVITPTTFGTVPVCETPTVVVPGCVSASTAFSQTLAVTSAGQVDTVAFTLCPNYNSAVPNTLRVIRPIVFCSEPSPAPCPSNSGLTVSSVNALGQPVFGPFSIAGNSALSVVMSGTQGTAGERYCLSLRQVAPWQGSFSYEFRLAGGTPSP